MIFFISFPKSPPKVVYSSDKVIRRFNCEEFLENGSSEGILQVNFVIFFCYLLVFIDEEFKAATRRKGIKIKESLDDIPFYDRKGCISHYG